MYKKRAQYLQKLGLSYQQSLELVTHYVKSENLADQLKCEMYECSIPRRVYNKCFASDSLSPFYPFKSEKLAFLCEEVELLKDDDGLIRFIDVDNILKTMGTFDDIFTVDSLQLQKNFWNYNVRGLFRSYIEVHESVDGTATLICRELDTLYPVENVLSLHKKHLKKVLLYLLSYSKKLNEIGKLKSIGFERIENKSLTSLPDHYTSVFLKSLGGVEANLMSLANPNSAYNRPMIAFTF